MNLTVLEPNFVERSPIFFQLLKFIMNSLPTLVNDGKGDTDPKPLLLFQMPRFQVPSPLLKYPSVLVTSPGDKWGSSCRKVFGDNKKLKLMFSNFFNAFCTETSPSSTTTTK
jgi:hypothetical protein